MDAEKLPLVMIIGKMNREVFRVLRRRTNEASDIKLTIEQFRLLHAASVCGFDVVQRDLADVLGKDKSSILRLTDSLEDLALVKRVPDPHDRRRNCLVVTELGHAVIAQYLEIEFKLIEELKQGLTESDMNIFFKVIQTIQKNAENLQADTGPRE